MTKTNTVKIDKKPDSTFVLNFTLDQKSIIDESAHVLFHLQQHFKSKGFRPGKVPLEIVKKEADSQQILEEAANHLISDIYSKSLEEHQLKPIVQPKVKILNPPLDDTKDWQVEITGCELPEIKLNDKLEAEMKKVNASKPEKHLDLVVETLLKNVDVSLPSILIEAELSHRLSQLIDQTQQAGISVQAYLKSKGTTIEKYQSELTSQISQEWTLNLAIDQIAKNQKMTVDPKKIEELTAQNPQLKSNPNLVYFLLQQQMVLDYLKNL